MTETDTTVLIAARLSRLVKGRDQLSMERQDDGATAYAAEVGDDAPLLAADPGVSGSVSPFKRPALGPYLTDNPPAEWTELVASAIDRLGRNARDLAELRAWCDDHGKRITILSPRLHWPPAKDDFSSPIVWAVLEALAEIELRQTKKRYADTREFIRGRKSMIGRPCWGFEIVGPKLGKTIVPVVSKVPALIKMVDMAFAGKPNTDIAGWLTAEGIKPALWEWWAKRDADNRGDEPSTQWAAESVAQILRNESLYGVYRQDGKILLHHQGIMDKQRWDELQAVLDANPKRRGPTRNAPAMLTDILYCAKCERVMHARRITGHARKDGTRPVWVGYRCDGTPREPSVCKNMVRADDIEPWVDAWFTADGPFAEHEIRTTIRVPAKGYADEVAELELEIRELDLDDPDYDETHAALRAERARLLALGTVPAHTEERETGVLVGQHWPTLDDAGKRGYLRRAKDVKVYASKEDRWITGDPHKLIGSLVHEL
jgi:site-specific DNA recombinase